MVFSWERARVCFATVSAAFGKNKRDIPAGTSAGRTHDIDTKFGVNKKGAEACEKRERERAKARKAKATYIGSFSFDVEFSRTRGKASLESLLPRYLFNRVK